MPSGCTRSSGTRSTSPSSASAPPLLASAALAWMVLSRRDTDPALRAFVSTALGLHGAPRRPGRAVRRRLRGHDRRALPAHPVAAARGRALRVDLARRTARAPGRAPALGPRRRRRGHGADRAARDARDAPECTDRRRPHAPRLRGLGPRRARRRRPRRGRPRARAPAAPRMGDRRGRRCRPRAPVGRRRRSDRRRVGARGASGDRLRAADLARRGRARRRDPARDR